MNRDYGFLIGHEYRHRVWKYKVLEINDDLLTVKTDQDEIIRLSAPIARRIADEMELQHLNESKTIEAVNKKDETIALSQNIRQEESTSLQETAKQINLWGKEEQLAPIISNKKPKYDLIKSYLQGQNIKTSANAAIFEVELRKYKASRLYFMAYHKSAPSIMTWGIFCHQLADKFGLKQFDFSDQDVQCHRGKIHNLVPLYFTPYNPMKYVWIHGSSIKPPRMKQEELIFFEFNSYSVFSIDGVQFSNINAARSESQLFSKPSDLNKLDWEAIQSKTFIENYKNRQAEVLIPGHLAASLIQCVIVFNAEQKEWLKRKYEEQLEIFNLKSTNYANIPITISKRYYY